MLLSLILIDQRHADCAVLFAAPRLGCDVSSRVPGRRDAALHEHALMSGVPCKETVQPSLNLISFSHESYVSGSFYRIVLHDQRPCLQVLWFEPPGTTICKQSNTIQLFECLHKHTVPMQYNLTFKKH